MPNTVANNFKKQKGLSLIEIMAAVCLVAIVVVFAPPTFNRIYNTNLGSSTKNLTALIKATYDQSIFTNKVMRLAFNLDKQTYWVEVLQKSKVVSAFASEETQHDLQELEEEMKHSSDKPQPLEVYAKDISLTEKELSLPGGIIFKSVHNKRSEKILTSGVAHTYFFPHGYAEDTFIHLQLENDEKVVVSLRIRPLTGKVNFYEQHKDYDGKN